MAAASFDEPRSDPSGCNEKPTAEYLVDPCICRKVAKSVSNKWLWLGRELGLEEQTLEVINSDFILRGVEEMAYQTLLEWQRRCSNTPPSVNVLAESLRKIDRVDLANEILKMAMSSKTHLSTPYTPKVFQPTSNSSRRSDVWASLKSTSEADNKQLYIPRIPWLKGWEMNFEDYYVDLTIKYKNEEAKPFHLHDVFNSNGPKEDIFTRVINKMRNYFSRSHKFPTRSLVEGPAGYGKSTLARKLCFDHSKREKYIRHFELVLLMRLREFEGTLEEMIINTLQLKNCNTEQLLDTMTQNQRKILLILDGFDELHCDKHDRIIPLIKGQLLPQATVIVTSRHGYVELKNEKLDSSAPNLLCCMDSRIVIKGVKGENRSRFLRMYLNGYLPEKADSFIKSVEEKYGLSEKEEGILFDCPLFLVLLVFVAEETGMTSVDSKTQLYKRLLNFVLRRMMVKEGQSDQKFDFFEFDHNKPPIYVEALCRFGWMAGEALRKCTYAFTEEEILSCCGNDDTILKLGILTQNDSKIAHKRKSWFEPIHLSFLEFSFAYSVWVSVFRKQNFLCFSYPSNIVNIIRLLRGNKLVTSFICGLCWKQIPALFSAFTYDHETMLEVVDTFDCVELMEESQLPPCEVAKYFLQMIPSEFRIFEISDNLPSLLKNIFKHAAQARRNRRVIFEYRSLFIPNENYNLPLNLQPYEKLLNSELSDLDFELSALNSELSQLTFKLSALGSTFSDLVLKLNSLISKLSHVLSVCLNVCTTSSRAISKGSHLLSKVLHLLFKFLHCFPNVLHLLSKFSPLLCELPPSDLPLSNYNVFLSDFEVLQSSFQVFSSSSELLTSNFELLSSIFQLLSSNSELLRSNSELLQSNFELLSLNSKFNRWNSEFRNVSYVELWNLSYELKNFRHRNPEILLSNPVKHDWCELITNQNIVINYSSTAVCKLAFTIREAQLDEQLRWLSNFITIEEPFRPTEKPIHEIRYYFSELQLKETLSEITEMIRQDKVVSLKLRVKHLSHVLPAEQCEEFLYFANTSNQLLEMTLYINTKSPLIVDLGSVKGKTWRRLELRGDIVPHVACVLVTQNELNLESFVRELPSRIQFLRVPLYKTAFGPSFVFVQNNGEPKAHNLRELHITFSSGTNSLLQCCIRQYLQNLQVLSIALSTDFKPNEEEVITFILSLIHLCPSLTTLELWQGCTEQFLAAFLEGLKETRCPAMINQRQDVEKCLHLDTLTVSPLISSKENIPEISTVNLTKCLLQSGILRQICISFTEYEEGYAKRDFLKEFSPEAGFTSELTVTSLEQKYTWKLRLEESKSHSIAIFKISPNKSTQS